MPSRVFVQNALDGIQKAGYALNFIDEDCFRALAKNDFFNQARLRGVVEEDLFDGQIDGEVRIQGFYESRFSRLPRAEKQDALRSFPQLFRKEPLVHVSKYTRI